MVPPRGARVDRGVTACPSARPPRRGRWRRSTPTPSDGRAIVREPRTESTTLSARWNAPIAVPAAASVLLGFAFAGVGPVPTSGTWIVAGLGLALLLGVVHFACARWGLALVPGLVAVPLLMGAGIRAWIAPEPGSRVGALLTLVVVAGGAWLWARVLARPSGEEAPGA